MAKAKKAVESEQKAAPAAAPEAQEAREPAKPAISEEQAEVTGNCNLCGQDPKACNNEHVEVEFTDDVGLNGRMFRPGQRSFMPKNALGAFLKHVKVLKE